MMNPSEATRLAAAAPWGEDGAALTPSPVARKELHSRVVEDDDEEFCSNEPEQIRGGARGGEAEDTTCSGTPVHAGSAAATYEDEREEMTPAARAGSGRRKSDRTGGSRGGGSNGRVTRGKGGRFGGRSGGSRSGGSKKKKKRCESFGLYIYKVLKSIHTETGIGKLSMAIMNSFINDTLDRLCTEALKLLVISKKKTLTRHEMKAAAKLLIPGELFRHAYEEANEAVNKFEAVRDALKNFPTSPSSRLL